MPVKIFKLSKNYLIFPAFVGVHLCGLHSLCILWVYIMDTQAIVVHLWVIELFFHRGSNILLCIYWKVIYYFSLQYFTEKTNILANNGFLISRIVPSASDHRISVSKQQHFWVSVLNSRALSCGWFSWKFSFYT